MYCGIKNIPKGKIRGTEEYCINNNQIRYYGIKAINSKLVEKLKEPKLNYTDEATKYRKLVYEAQKLIKDVKTIKFILGTKGLKPSIEKSEQKKLKKLLQKRDILVQKIKKQEKIVRDIEKAEEEKIKKNNKYRFIY